MTESSLSIPRNNELDLLRLLLATSVVWHHIKITGFQALPYFIANIPAVPCFIFISGFLVANSFENSKSFYEYGFKRVRRIFPAYFLIVIAFGYIVWLLGGAMSLSGSGSLLNLLKYYFYNLIFLNFLHPCVFNALHPTQISDCAVNGSLWTIKFELIFYLSLPVIVFVVRKINPKICACLLALMLTFSSVTNSIYLVIFICFLSGVLLYHSKAVYLLSTIPLYVSPFVRQIALIIAVFACAYLIVPLFLSCLLFFVISFFPTHGKGVSIRVNTFGDLSYGIYLVHYQSSKY